MECVASKKYQELTSVLPCMYLFGITVILTTWFIPNYFLVSVTEILEHWIRNEKESMHGAFITNIIIIYYIIQCIQYAYLKKYIVRMKSQKVCSRPTCCI